MKYKALRNFTGLIAMKKGDVKEIKDQFIVDDLLNAGYIEAIEDKPTVKKTVAKKTAK